MDSRRRLSPHKSLTDSTSPAVHNIQHKSEDDAQKDRGGEGEIESRILSAIDDVARQTSQGQVGATRNYEDHTYDNQNYADRNEQLSEISHGREAPC